ncbi:MAG: 2,3-dihydroxy-p-cumate/2,3-dihydroxybenzoate 3,4-dioxygenase, partial [Burkholderiales bacterium]
MIELKDIRYVRLGTRNVGQATEYAQKILGLELVRKEQGACYFRSDNRDHTLVYFEGDPRDHTVAFELANASEFQAAATALSDAGYQVVSGSREACDQRAVGNFINFKDPSGNSIDLVLRPHHSGRRYFPSRDAG